MNKAKETLDAWMFEQGFSTYKELAEYLGTKPATLDAWKQRKEIPKKSVLKYNFLNANHGEGSMKKPTKKSAKEMLETWMRYENLESLEALAQFLERKLETLQAWIQNDEIPERDIRRYKLTSFEAFRHTSEAYKTEIYSIHEKQFYGKEVYHHSQFDAHSSAEWLLEKYNIEYYEVEEARFEDLENDNIALHVKYSVKHEHELASLKSLIRDEIDEA